MIGAHLVRFGAMPRVGLFPAVDATRYPRGARVILRTGRGLEIGEVLSEPDEDHPGKRDGAILRGMTVEDQLLEARLEKNRNAAYEACAARLGELQLPVTLMDVEHLFDGRTLLFYFLGDATDELTDVLAELSELYETKAQFRAFTDAVVNGCGPDCGTADGAGCTSCATGCAIAGACGSPKR